MGKEGEHGGLRLIPAGELIIGRETVIWAGGITASFSIGKSWRAGQKV